MNTESPSLLSIELKSIAIGYRALQKVTTFETIRVLEASPCGDRFLILAIGPTTELELAQTSVRESLDSTERDHWLDAELIKDCEPTVLQAIYHLPQTQAAESLLVAECGSISGLLATAQSLVHGHEIEVIEIKVKRAGGGAYGFFTGRKDVCAPAAEEARTKMKRAMREGQVEVIDELTANFREHFNLNGAV
jgi:hypothetical protein